MHEAKRSNFCSGWPKILRHIFAKSSQGKLCLYTIQRFLQYGENGLKCAVIHTSIRFFRTSTPRRFAYNNNERSVKFCGQNWSLCSLVVAFPAYFPRVKSLEMLFHRFYTQKDSEIKQSDVLGASFVVQVVNMH